MGATETVCARCSLFFALLYCYLGAISKFGCDEGEPSDVGKLIQFKIMIMKTLEWRMSLHTRARTPHSVTDENDNNYSSRRNLRSYSKTISPHITQTYGIHCSVRWFFFLWHCPAANVAIKGTRSHYIIIITIMFVDCNCQLQCHCKVLCAISSRVEDHGRTWEGVGFRGFKPNCRILLC